MKQKTIDFTARGSRLRLLDRLALPKAPGASGAAMVAVLRCLEAHHREHAKCRVGVALISTETGLSPATVKRVTGALRGLAVLSVVRTGRTAIYQIIWSNLIDYDAEQMSPQIAHDEPADSSYCASRGRTVSPQIAHDEPATEAPYLNAKVTATITDQWAAAAALLREIGVGSWRDGLAAVRERGATVDDLNAAVTHWRENAAQWANGAGALVYWLRTGTWPPAKATARKPPPRDSLAAGEYERTRIFKACRARGMNQRQIEQELERAGLEV